MSDDKTPTGYGNPPRHSQFKPGQSGNPKGRPRGVRGLKTDLREVLAARHSIQVNGKRQSGTRQHLTLLTLAIRASGGDLKAQGLLIPLIVQVLGIEDLDGVRRPLSANDRALLEQLLEGLGTAASPDAAGPEANGKPGADTEGQGVR